MLKSILEQSAPAPDSVWPLARDWAEIFAGRAGAALAAALQHWLPSRRWFRGKARTIGSVALREQILVPMGREKAYLLLFQVNYTENDPEWYVLPLACAFGRQAELVSSEWPQTVLAKISLDRPRRQGVIHDAIVSKDFCRALLALTAHSHQVAGRRGQLEAEPTGILRRLRRERRLDMEPSVSKAEQSNSSVIYGHALILKFFRRLDPGINPELEIERFLSARHFAHSPALAGALEYHGPHGQTSTVAVVTSFVPGCHDAWEDTLAALKRFYQRVTELPPKLRRAPPASETSGSILGEAPAPRKPADLVGTYLEDARTLGRRTAALHLTLASDESDPAFRPEPWTAPAQRSLLEDLLEMERRNFLLLGQRMPTLPADCQHLAQKVLLLESHLTQRFSRLARPPASAVRIRTHGDYHLGQMLHHGSDFLIIDYEGEPALPLAERRAKQSALRDVAGMIYSFFYAANAALRDLPGSRSSVAEIKAGWARYWAVWVGTTFLRSYLETARPAAFIPEDDATLKLFLEVELLRKAIYELGYELNNRPDWLNVTFQVLLDLVNPENPI